MKKELVRWLNQSFGIDPDFFQELELVKLSSEIWLCTPEAARVSGPIRRRGVKICVISKKGFKLTSQGAMILGRLATKNTLYLNQEQALAFMQGKDLDNPGLDNGQVIVFWRDFPVGVGLVQENRIKNQLAAHRRLPPARR